MKFLSLLCLAIVLLIPSQAAFAEEAKRKELPWTGAFNFCDYGDSTVVELRQYCIDWYAEFAGMELDPPVVMTVCPPAHAVDQHAAHGNHPWITPNSYCQYLCPEYAVEVVCTISWEASD
jgi:hypothetical protein